MGGCPTDYAVDAVLGIIYVTICLREFWKWDEDEGLMHQTPRVANEGKEMKLGSVVTVAIGRILLCNK